MKKNLRAFWKSNKQQNIKNKTTRTNILLLVIHMLMLKDKLGSKTHVMIDTNKKFNRKQTGVHLDSKRFSSLELLGSVSDTKLTNCSPW